MIEQIWARGRSRNEARMRRMTQEEVFGRQEHAIFWRISLAP